MLLSVKGQGGCTHISDSCSRRCGAGSGGAAPWRRSAPPLLFALPASSKSSVLIRARGKTTAPTDCQAQRGPTISGALLPLPSAMAHVAAAAAAAVVALLLPPLLLQLLPGTAAAAAAATVWMLLPVTLRLSALILPLHEKAVPVHAMWHAAAELSHEPLSDDELHVVVSSLSSWWPAHRCPPSANAAAGESIVSPP
eukprot:COSAG05_NODE_738_length_7631_cov_2086.673128_6_plen_197_part_00